MRSSRMTALVVVIAGVLSVVLVGCDSNGGGTQGTGGDGGAQVLVWGAEQEPPALNNWTNSGNTVWTGIVTTPVLQSLMIYKPDFSYEPQLLAKLPELISESPQVARYELDPNAAWDDGSPVTADDVQATLDAVLNPDSDVVSRLGYDLIVGGKLSGVSPDKKQFTIEFAEPFTPWRELFTSSNQPLLKASALQGADFNTFMNDRIPFASGPYRFKSWTKGSDLTLEVNPNYWDSPAAVIPELDFRFMPEAETQLKNLDSSEVQVIYPQPQPEIVSQLAAMEGVDFSALFGPQWEHVDYNLTNPMLAETSVRQALNYMVDRELIAERVARPVDGSAQVLQNVVYVPSQAEYEEHWQVFRQDFDRAAQLLQGAGYSKGSDGVWQKDGQRLSFAISTTTDNPAREDTEEILIEAWRQGGVEVKTDNYPADVLFERIPTCQYEIALFAYQAGPDPFGSNGVYRGDDIACPGAGGIEGGQNTTAINDPAVTDLLDRTDAELDPAKRADVYNQVDAALVQNPPTLPLYQKATVLAWRQGVQGLEDNPTIQGPTWNSQDWRFS